MATEECGATDEAHRFVDHADRCFHCKLVTGDDVRARRGRARSRGVECAADLLDKPAHGGKANCHFCCEELVPGGMTHRAVEGQLLLLLDPADGTAARSLGEPEIARV